MRTGVRLEKGDEMNKNLKMPWGIKDTIENLKELKEILKTHMHKINHKGRAESDAEEIEFDFNRAIKALEKQTPKKLIPNQYREWDCPNCNSSINVILYQGAYCPNCGQHWEKYPEKLTNKNDGLPYCSGCGQASD